MAKLLASEAAWEAANICLTTFGGYGFAREYDVERKFRETRLLTIAPVSNNLILAFLGGLPTWPHSREWGYYPSGLSGLLLIILILLLVTRS